MCNSSSSESPAEEGCFCGSEGRQASDNFCEGIDHGTQNEEEHLKILLDKHSALEEGSLYLAIEIATNEEEKKEIFFQMKSKVGG